MSDTSRKRSEDFLRISAQFKLGALVTESSHPLTATLSEAARGDISSGLDQLFDVDSDIIKKYRDFVESGRAGNIQQTVLNAVRNGGKIFFTGCGSTGRLSIQLVSIWRDFWQRQRARGLKSSPSTRELEDRAFSVMAGGDYALIKAVEGFEDFTDFGKQQIGDLGVGAKDVVFAITEGGETSFVIGTAWKGVEAGAKVYFVYNNPDDILCKHVERSREVIEDERIEKINLTTGPMAITGSTRMQATTIQLCALVTILEMTARELMGQLEPRGPCGLDPATVPNDFLHKLMALHARFKSPKFLNRLAALVALEESVYRGGRKNNYFADQFGIDVLTDTTERSPTYCMPPFRKFDDQTATESWAFLFVPQADTAAAWEHIIKRKPRCVEWSEKEIRQLVPPDKLERTLELMPKISFKELMRFRIGLDGLGTRPLDRNDCAVGILGEEEKDSLLSPSGFHRVQLEAARAAGASIGLIVVGRDEALKEIEDFVAGWAPDCILVPAPVPRTDFLLDGATRAGVKMLLNALSTCTMVRLGRVMGNYMVWVVPSNLKLIDRSTRYIQKLAGIDYATANELLFEVIEYVEPRMKSDRAYPPVVGLSVLRHRYKLSNEEAERRLLTEMA
jgi:N-acetylmuramic acid 6-phosphate etherase